MGSIGGIPNDRSCHIIPAPARRAGFCYARTVVPEIGAGASLEGGMPSSCGIAIVGGGLAGLAAAHALNTFGMQPEVFEAAAGLGEIGAAVNVSPQAFKPAFPG